MASPLVKLANPTAPAGTAYACAWDASGTYLAVGHGSSPYLTIYKKNPNNTLTKLSVNINSLPSATVYALDWSGDYLAVGCTSGTRIILYKRTGDNLVKMTVDVNVDYGVNGVAWSADGNHLAVVHSTLQFIVLYRRDGDVLTRLTDPAALAGQGRACVWSGSYLAVAHLISPFVTLYSLSGDTLTKLAAPTSAGGSAYGCAWSGSYLAVGTWTNPYLALYKRNGDSLSKLTNPAAVAGPVKGCSFSGLDFAVAHNTSPFLSHYKLSGDLLVKQEDPPVLAGGGLGVSWSDDGEYLAAATAVSPYVEWYSLPPVPTGSMSAISASLIADLEGFTPVTGIISSVTDTATVNLTGSHPGAFGRISAALDDVISNILASFQWTSGNMQAITDDASAFCVAYHDWSGVVSSRPDFSQVYRAYLAKDGQTTIELPMSSWQASLNFGERNSYVSAIIPGVSLHGDAISARSGGTMTIKKGYRNGVTGEEQLEELFSISLTSIRLDQGSSNESCSLEGLATLEWPPAKSVDLNGITYRRTDADGSLNLRGSVDLRVRPGDTVTYDGASFVVGRLSIQVSVQGETMEITEA